mmetsp:Transcript_40198/g.94125  ORF Transcript_40198/g.94125 Transcript_40198/m.94125 type:complete len:92 (-) Transcript_40198:12-287(-)
MPQLGRQALRWIAGHEHHLSNLPRVYGFCTSLEKRGRVITFGEAVGQVCARGPKKQDAQAQDSAEASHRVEVNLDAKIWKYRSVRSAKGQG